MPQFKISAMQRRRKFNRTGRFNRQAVVVQARGGRGLGVFQPRSLGRKEEKKNIDVNTNTTITFGQTTSNAGVALNAMAEGVTPVTHVGRHVNMKSIQFRWVGSLAPTTTGSSPLRCLVVYDKQTNGAVPATTAVVTVDEIQSPLNLQNNRRFVILADQEVPCVGTQGPQSWDIKFFRKIDLPVEFNDNNSGSITDITTGGVYAFFWQEGQLLVASPTSSFYSRIRFTDA